MQGKHDKRNDEQVSERHSSISLSPFSHGGTKVNGVQIAQPFWRREEWRDGVCNIDARKAGNEPTYFIVAKTQPELAHMTTRASQPEMRLRQVTWPPLARLTLLQRRCGSATLQGLFNDNVARYSILP